MPEHTPAPLPHRAVYGFAFYLLFLTLFLVYTFWTLLPTSILEGQLGLYYLPDKYFALYIPVLVLCAVTIFAFFIYPSISLVMTPDITDKCILIDSHTVLRCKWSDCDNELLREDKWTEKKFCEEHEGPVGAAASHNQVDVTVGDKEVCSHCQSRHTSPYLQGPQLKRCPRIPPVRDLDIQDVCKELFR